MPPNRTRDLEAKIERLKYEIQSLQRDLQSTQDSLDSWYEVNLNSIQGVCVDESVATTVSSASRITELAISHLPQAGGDPERFPQRDNLMPKAASTLGSIPNTPPARISQTPVAVHNSYISMISLPIESTEATDTQSLIVEDQKERSRGICY